ncbi:MAG: ATP-dependent helicase [Planctomycetota bacterium]
MELDDLLDDLNEPQREAVAHFRGPLLILAGAGSGKTRVITRRIAYLLAQGVPAKQILGVTFTNKAAGEMRERVLAMAPHALDLQLSTFHAFCAKFLRLEHDALGLSASFNIYDMEDQRAAMKQVLKDLGLDPTFYKPAGLLGTISRAKNDGLTPDDYEREHHGQQARNTADAWRGYHDKLRNSDALDFDDLLLEVHRILRNEADVRRHWQDRFRFILVDEYQDTNRLQAGIAQTLAERHGNICVTGDPDQAIYSWRGAEVSNILEFEQQWPDVKRVTLDINYRSTPTILKAANAVIDHNASRLEKQMQAACDDGPKLRRKRLSTEEAEAAWVARSISDLCAGLGEQGDDLSDLTPDGMPVRFDECAVFYRTNAQSRVIELAMRAAGIPYEVVRGVEFYQRSEIKDLMAYLRVLHNPRDEVSLLRIINTPSRGIGASTVASLLAYAAAQNMSVLEVVQPANLAHVGLATRPQKMVREFARLMGDLRERPTVPVSKLLEGIIGATDYESYLKKDDALRFDDRMENVRELISDALKHDQHATGDDEYGAGLGGYLERVTLVSDADALGGTDASGLPQARVPLLTLHAAKGLEFPVVFLTGMEQGVFPHSRVLDEGNLEEERRLAYVGITRAMRRLYLSHVEVRTQAGRMSYGEPSVFLREIPDELLNEPLSADLGVRSRMQPSMYMENADDGRYPWRRGAGRALTSYDAGGDEYTDESAREPSASSSPRIRGTAGSPPSDMVTIELEDPWALSSGDRVYHSMYGMGVMVALRGNGLNLKVEVEFDDAGVKLVPFSPKLVRVLD